jgi:hypothetical protein
MPRTRLQAFGLHLPTFERRVTSSDRRLRVTAFTVTLLLFGLGFASGFIPQGWKGPDPGETAKVSALSRQDGQRDPPKTAQAALLESRLPSGALKVAPDSERIVPYFANLAAMALVGSRPAVVKEYLLWYLAHLNRPDRFGLQGTIYDYTVDSSGCERPTARYDSADSYASTFLSLVRAYVDETQDCDFARDNLPNLELVASVVYRLQDTDGLVWATAARREKFLMDNAENYRGLSDYADLLAALGLSEAASRAGDVARRISEGVESRLWDARRGNYAWGIYTYWLGGFRLGEARQETNWRRWYPDTVAQVFPVICGLLDPSDLRAVSLYENLNAWHPQWVNQHKSDPHPWSLLGYGAAVMGDIARASAFVRATSEVYLANPGRYSNLSWELAWHLLTLRRISQAGIP